VALNLGSLRQQITIERPGTPTPDGDGGYAETWAALAPPTAWASIEPASQRALERLVAGTVIAQASHIVRLRFHPGIDERCRISWVDATGATRVANVTDVTDPEERGIELVLVVAEVPA
jgi:head-tail adaptor